MANAHEHSIHLGRCASLDSARGIQDQVAAERPRLHGADHLRVRRQDASRGLAPPGAWPTTPTPREEGVYERGEFSTVADSAKAAARGARASRDRHAVPAAPP